MLSREEQAEIMRKALSLARKNIDVRRRVEKSEMSPKRAKEVVTEAEEELRDLLKEVG